VGISEPVKLCAVLQLVQCDLNEKMGF
jgi:hypothetical protein